MSNGLITSEFILLCIIQVITIGISLLTLVRSFKRYFNIDRSEIILRKSVKYFTFIFITIVCAGFFSLFVNFFYIYTQNAIISGYLYGTVTTTSVVNIFCAWQFLTYLIHPERRKTKYILGTLCLIGIVIEWFSVPTMDSVLTSPNVQADYLYLYIYLLCIFGFVYSIFAYDFFKASYKSPEKKEKIRFLCMGLTGLLILFMYPVGTFGLIYSWSLILSSTILLYLGYNFPKFFQSLLKI